MTNHCLSKRIVSTTQQSREEDEYVKVKMRKIYLYLEVIKSLPPPPPQGVHADRASITLVEKRIEDDDDDVKYRGSNRELLYQVLEVDCESPPIN